MYVSQSDSEIKQTFMMYPFSIHKAIKSRVEGLTFTESKSSHKKTIPLFIKFRFVIHQIDFVAGSAGGGTFPTKRRRPVNNNWTFFQFDFICVLRLLYITEPGDFKNERSDGG